MATDNKIYTQLTIKAQAGNKESLERLAELSRERLVAYITRVTMNQNVIDDLVQDTLLQMISSIESLRKPERYWPWLYRIAYSKINTHHRQSARRPVLTPMEFDEDTNAYYPDVKADDGLDQLLRKENIKKLFAAISELKNEHRSVLSLRCFDQLAYTDIADTLGCSVTSARLSFFRAKKDLKKRLTRQGLSKHAILLALGVFGTFTRATQAGGYSTAVTVNPAIATSGTSATVVGTIFSKIGAATLAVLTIGTMTLSQIPLSSTDSRPILDALPLVSSLPHRKNVSSIHYTEQSPIRRFSGLESLSKGAYEKRAYFPDGIDGPMFRRMQRWTPLMDRKLCKWLQDDQANYYYGCGNNTVYINNYRLFRSGMKVFRLSTDSREFTEFLDKNEGVTRGIQIVRDDDRNILHSRIDDRCIDTRNFETIYKYNVLSKDDFHYDNWVGDSKVTKVVDDRDQMHKRGWTFFKVTGWINGEPVSGKGRVPFVYKTCKEHWPWLKLKIGDNIELIDLPKGAFFANKQNNTNKYYPAGSFFKGLTRPWVGLHSVDSVRRDAVESRLYFKTDVDDDYTESIVTINNNNTNILEDALLTYTIDLDNDLIKKIQLQRGFLRFEYLDDVDSVSDQFTPPSTPLNSEKGKKLSSKGLNWLINLF